MRNNIYFKWFMESLRGDQKKDYQQRSTNEQNIWYISYLEDHYSSKWICTDPDCNQHRMNISETIFKFREDRIVNPEKGTKETYTSTIDLADYTRKDIIDNCLPFGYKRSYINKWIDDQSNNSLLAECIFEMEN